MIQGASIQTGNSVALAADNKVSLLAAKNESSQTSSNSSSSGSIGVSFSPATNSVGFSVSASKGQGAGNGRDTSYTDTRIATGNKFTLQSGGNANVKGAVIPANATAGSTTTSGIPVTNRV